MLHFSRSKIISIIAISIIAILLALPNLFSDQKISKFPSFIPSQKVNLGLDLQGGSHLLLEVDTASIKIEKIEDLTFDIRRMLKKDGIKYNNLKIVEDTINFRISDTSLVNSLVNDIKDLSQSISQNALSAQNKSNLEIQTKKFYF